MRRDHARTECARALSSGNVQYLSIDGGATNLEGAPLLTAPKGLSDIFTAPADALKVKCELILGGNGTFLRIQLDFRWG